MKSIQQNLNISLSISLILIFSLFWLISVFSLHHLTENYVVTRLHHDNDSIVEHLKIEPNALDINLNNINPIYSRLYSGHYFVVKTASSQLKSPSLNGYALYLKPIQQKTEVYETLGPDNQTVLVRGAEMMLKNTLVKIYVAEDHSTIQRTIRLFDVIIAALSLLSLLTLYFLQRHLLQKGFNRLAPINDSLKALHQGKALKLNPNDYPSEVTSLIESLNQAILSAAALLEKSRQSNANLAHSLKTPLNIIYQVAEDARLSTTPELQATLADQSEKILRLIERELKGARLASGMVSMQPFSLKQDLDDLVKSLKQLYPITRFEIHNVSNKPQLPLEKEDGFELLGNLLDNACKYGQSLVQLKLSADAQNFIIEVEDDGKGLPASALKQIQQRGFRLDETKPGHGIGLSIVKQIVNAYHGDIEFSLSSDGGLRIKVNIPLQRHIS